MNSFTLRGTHNTYLIYRFLFEPVKSNMYVLLSNKEALVFDPNENNELLELLQEKQIQKVSILLTHEHYDHTSGVCWLQSHYDAKVYCQKLCADAISNKRGNNPSLVAFVCANMDKLDGGNRYQVFKEHFTPYSIKTDVSFEEKVEWNIAGINIKGMSTPGHTLGSAFYWIDYNIVFTGDTILQDNPVILNFPNSEESIYKEKTLPYINTLEPETLLVPGHGDPFFLKDRKF